MGESIASLVSTAVLTTTYQYLLSHCSRTGDADAIFVLLFTIAMISMTKIDENIKWLYLSGLSFSFAFLAKSWHAFAIVAIGGLYLLISGHIFKLRIRQWILFITATFLPISIWGIFRYTNDGLEFFRNMINHDLVDRTTTPLAGHSGGLLFYFNIVQNYYHYWLTLLFAMFIGYLILACRKSNKEEITYWLYFCGLLFLFYYLQ